MELFIRVVDGQPFEHPIFGDNFREAFPDVDVDNLPAEFARFERVAQPHTAGVYEVEEYTYQWVDGVVKDVWVTRPMTDAEKSEKVVALTNSANATIAFFKSTVQDKIDHAPNEEARQTWIDFAAQVNAWVLVDPAAPNIPRPPVANIDVNLLQVQV
jgi:hypothetical protein